MPRSCLAAHFLPDTSITNVRLTLFWFVTRNNSVWPLDVVTKAIHSSFILKHAFINFYMQNYYFTVLTKLRATYKSLVYTSSHCKDTCYFFPHEQSIHKHFFSQYVYLQTTYQYILGKCSFLFSAKFHRTQQSFICCHCLLVLLFSSPQLCYFRDYIRLPSCMCLQPVFAA